MTIFRSDSTPQIGDAQKFGLIYAQLGFYVFDWNLHGGPYKREREPTSNMDTELKRKLMAMASTPSLPVKFTELKEMANV